MQIMDHYSVLQWNELSGYEKKWRESESVKSLSHVWLFVTPMDCGPPDSSVHGILQARILERIAISFYA